MITFPETLNISLLVSDLLRIAAPFVICASIISLGFLLANVIKKA